MRLSQIKLAGFKSFVDPTVVSTPSQLVGVVGPNGCGKSNIIDAVRWVLGESRASELRGDSMHDVIFNGSTRRKPSNRASVELVFDNASGRAAGQWSSYSEIAIRRVLVRDGGSSYFINGQQVRRRDIHDIFLGTGLGVRGYAIIGQGMINRLIEARPEELRVFLEEAAGVSRYKERRRETENRLAATRENLQRLDDILSELQTQLAKLETQAELAQKYQSLQIDLQQKQQAFWLLKENEALATQVARQKAMAEAQIRLDEAVALLRATEGGIEQQRQAHYSASDRVHAVQGQLFEAGALVSRYETDIRHIADSRQRLEQRATQLATQIDEWTAQDVHCHEQLDALQLELEEAVARSETAAAQLDEAEERLPEFEEKERTAAAVQNRVQNELNRIEKELALREQARQSAVRQNQALLQKRDRLQAGMGALQGPDPGQAAVLGARVAALQDAQAADSKQLAALGERLQAIETQRQSARQVEREAADAASRVQAHLQALEALQEDIQTQAGLEGWLEQHGLASAPQLWQQVEVEPGWEAAVESALSGQLNARSTVGLDALVATMASAPPASVALFENPLALEESTSQTVTSGSAVQAIAIHPAGFLPLFSQVRGYTAGLRICLQQWLQGVYVADNLAAALAAREHLAAGQLVITREGHRIQRYSLVFYAPSPEVSGYLARQNQIKQLGQQVQETQQQAAAASEALRASQSLWQACSDELAALHEEQSQRVRELHQAELELSRWQQQEQQQRQRVAQLNDELAELEAQIEEVRAGEEQACVDAEALEAQQDACRAQFEREQAQLRNLSEMAAEMRAKASQARLARQEAGFEERGVRARMAELHRNREMARHQAGRGTTELNHLRDELADLDASLAREALDEALTVRAGHEAALAEARAALEAIDAGLRADEQKRLELEHSLEPLREAITALQLQEQEARLAVEQYAAELAGAAAERQALQAFIDSQEASWQRTAWLQAEQTRLKRQIEALGPVNLAALEELERARLRRGFLGSQYDDLTVAIHTLEDAIRKIDKETRELLQQTFDTVNAHFGELFPRLFGGGQARLIMSGDEILDAGVQLMAQPPGKRNSTIHLLSGGEKALTAIALVFAFFKLNPAPFCLLDEVDAPLDDANTARYADLVSSMSEQTQFFFISHNKIAMQMARQLVGVTMQEQGVSRIVAVDIETAIQMAAL